MKAMYINAPGEVEIKEINMPVRKEGEVLLKLLYGGICGSDLGSYRGTFAYFDYPRIPGHEFSAEVIEADENNEYGIKPGMIVTCNPYFNCGHCYSCTHGIVNACMDNQTMGCQRDGAFREYITMPVERVYDGKGLDPKTLAAIEPFCISYHGVSRANVKEGDKVLVVGAGTIGVLAAIAAKAKGATVYISDVSEGKLEMAKEFGVDGTLLNDSPEHFDKGVAELTEGNGFDVTIEAEKHREIVEHVQTIMTLKQQLEVAPNAAQRAVIERSITAVNNDLNSAIDELYQVQHQNDEE